MKELDERMEGIPTGNERGDIKAREKIITLYYVNWRRNHPEGRAFNEDLHDFIYVEYISLDETRRHAAKRYLSTLAVLRLDEVLKTAKMIGKPLPVKNGSKNQKVFSKMIRMGCHLNEIGDVKLMIGVKKKTEEKIQYCLTAVEQE